MPKGANQKFKLYRLAQIMCEKTDETHYLTMPKIRRIMLTDKSFQFSYQPVRHLLCNKF